MSDVFGLETDESRYVENLRKDRNDLLQLKQHSAKEKKTLKQIESTLNEIPIKSYSNSLITDEDRKMMQQVLKSYKK